MNPAGGDPRAGDTGRIAVAPVPTAPLPFAARVLVAALVLDALRALWAAGQAGQALWDPEAGSALATGLVPARALHAASRSLLTAACEGLLAMQLVARRAAGRRWGVAWLAVVGGTLAWHWAVGEPAAWVEAGAAGRLRILGSLALLALTAAWLRGPVARATFDR